MFAYNVASKALFSSLEGSHAHDISVLGLASKTVEKYELEFFRLVVPYVSRIESE